MQMIAYGSIYIICIYLLTYTPHFLSLRMHCYAFALEPILHLQFYFYIHGIHMERFICEPEVHLDVHTFAFVRVCVSADIS